MSIKDYHTARNKGRHRMCNQISMLGSCIKTYRCAERRLDIIVNQVPLVILGLGALRVRAAARAWVTEGDVGL